MTSLIVNITQLLYRSRAGQRPRAKPKCKHAKYDFERVRAKYNFQRAWISECREYYSRSRDILKRGLMHAFKITKFRV